MAENTNPQDPQEINLTPEQVNALIPVYAWLTRAETPKGGSGRGTANYWSFVGGMRPSIATLVAVHYQGRLSGDTTIGESLVEVPDLPDYPDAYVYTRKVGKTTGRFTTLRHIGMHLLNVGETHPLATPAGVSVPDLARWLKAAAPDAMERVTAQREEQRRERERRAAAELLNKQIRDLRAAVEVAEKNGLDVSAQRQMLAAFEQQAAQMQQQAETADQSAK